MPPGNCEPLTTSPTDIEPPQVGPTQLQPMNREDTHGVSSLTIELFGN